MSVFLNRRERNKSCMSERGYEYRKVVGSLENTIKDTGGNVDVEGFHLPKEMKPLQNYGIFCAIFGAAPKNRVLDIRLGMDRLAKDVYESEMDVLADTFRLAEYKTLLCFAHEDAQKESEKQRTESEQTKSAKTPPGNSPRKESRKPRFKARIELNEDRLAIRDAVTWRYKWIQAYKKDCYLFAQYKAEELLSEQADKDSEQKTFCEAFIKMAEDLPETNRRLLDRMYETAWRVYFQFCLGVQPGCIPKPWYDTVTQGCPPEPAAEDGAKKEADSADEDDMEYWG